MVNVLVVDDHTPTRRLLEDTLQKFGYSVDTAEDGVEALRKFNGHEVVIMDYSMPNMDGCDTTRIMRARGSEARIYILTGDPEGVRKKGGFGETAILSKDTYLLPAGLEQLTKYCTPHTGQP